MKKIISIFIFLFCINTSKGVIYNVSLDLYNQNVVNMIPFNYPGITGITGNLTIYQGTGAPLYDLSGLNGLFSVGGYVAINAKHITNLSGLNNLNSIGSYLNICYDSSMTTISGFSSLTNIGGNLFIYNNSSLISITGFNSLNSVVGSFNIQSCQQLTSISGFNNLTTAGGFGLSLPYLNNISGFNNLSSVNGNFVLYNNYSLPSLNVFSNLTTVNGFLQIYGNTTITSLNGLGNISINNNPWYISLNSSLSQCALPNICSVNASNTQFGGGNLLGCNSQSQILAACGNLPSILNLKLFIQGYYLTNGIMASVLMNQGELTNPSFVDSITVELRNPIFPYNLTRSTKTVLMNNGSAICSFTPSISGSYFVVVKSRNGVQIWSALPVVINQYSTTYDFSNLSNKTYGGNVIQMEPNKWAVYSGDMDQDGSIDVFDYLLIDTDIVSGNNGYLNTDLNGDGTVDAFDYLILDPNIISGIGIIKP